MALGPGTQIGPYEIVAPLGAGGMGEVSLAFDRLMMRRVAMKSLRADPKNLEDRERYFLEEARLTAVEDRINCELEMGRHLELTAELEALVAHHARHGQHLRHGGDHLRRNGGALPRHERGGDNKIRELQRF